MWKSLLPFVAALALGAVTFVVARQIMHEGQTPPGAAVLVVYHADWCGPCRMFERTLASSEVSYALDTAGIRVQSINVDRRRDGAWSYDGGGIPAYALVQGSSVVRVGHGYRTPAAFCAWLDGR